MAVVSEDIGIGGWYSVRGASKNDAHCVGFKEWYERVEDRRDVKMERRRIQSVLL